MSDRTPTRPRPARGRHRLALLAAAGLTAAAVWVQPAAIGAVPNAPGTVLDDFDDGDASDWGFFGGNAAGGGGGAQADRPAEGSHYLSTGWGGNGTDSGFYGGFFKNLDNAAQVVLPPDPWFNMWVLNQSNATVDRYTLEVTLREDRDGDGWTSGSEDSIGLDTPYVSSRFDDQWTLLSAPLSAFSDRGTGGNGVFDGTVDEVVIVIGGVEGVVGSAVELDIDTITFTSGAPAGFDEVVFDDMEHGDPFANSWFSFGGAVGGGGIAANAADVPPASGGAFSLETGWGSGGVPGFYGGFGRTNRVDASGTRYLNLWINPNADQAYTLEINLQDDDDGDDAIADPNNGGDDEFQYSCVVSSTGPCATAGGGWQLVSIPLADFVDDNSFLTGGNGVLDPTPAARGGNGQLVNVVVAVIGTGTDANFRTDFWTLTADLPGLPGTSSIIDAFESGVAPGTPCPPNTSTPDLGFCTFNGAGSSVSLSNPATPPAPARAGAGSPNSVLQMDVDSTSFAGFIRGFPTTQDWSTSEGISLWMYGTGSGSQLFIDILDNRNPGSTTDDAERWTVAFLDDVSGWHVREFPFASFVRKEVGNGAPNDGLGLFQMSGYAVGALGTGGARTYYVDDVSLYGVAEPPGVTVNLSRQNTVVEEGTTGAVAVKLNRPLGPDDPAEVSIDYATERSYAIAGEEYAPTNGTLTFVNGGPSELTFPVATFEDTKFEGDEQIVVRITNPVGVERGALFQGSVLIDDDDPFDPDLLDDFEQGAYLWETDGLMELGTERLALADPGARPGQDPVEQVATVSTPRSGPSLDATKRAVIDDLEALLPASNRNDRRRIVRAVEYIERSLDERNWENGFFLSRTRGALVFAFELLAVHELDRVGGTQAAAAAAAIDDLVGVDAELAGLALDVARLNDGNRTLVGLAEREIRNAEHDLARGRPEAAVQHYLRAWAWATAAIGFVSDPILGSLDHDFAIGQDWTDTQSLDLWFNGTGSGQEVTVTLADNRAPDPGPAAWTLAWSDEFDDAAGTPPNPANWAYEIGDTTPDGKNGWGNDERQYYTDDPDNAATDGNGNLVITLDQADGSQECYYGPCEFESARLITQHRAEFAYGRIESRLQVPTGGDGLWPAFWSLGTDITYNPWPGAGEIDVMEYVSRIPDEIFGTIHGPGYNGGGSFSGIYDFGQRVDQQYHTFAVEWQPDLITWFVDGIKYHEADPSDVAPNPWVFDKPFFLLLNFAIGGNFGGAIDPANTYPQEYLVDYVRVYQGPDTAERFETTFTDSVAGWQEVSIPVTDFVRSADQPAGAPNDGLTLSEVWGYGFELPYPAAGTYQFDLVRRTPVPPPTSLVVTNLGDSGPGSLREALGLIAPGGTISFDPALGAGTLTLTSGQLSIDRSVTIDASAVPGLIVSGNGASRVFQIAAGRTVAMNDLVIADGRGSPRGGGVLNDGTLRLERVVVRDNVQPATGPASFDLGGGGIYNGDGATLELIDSTVSDNVSTNQPGGGVYGFFNSTVTITRSTISGNLSGDVAGGLRSLGDVVVVNSTFSGNTSTAWHGGAVFATDGSVSISNSTIVDNRAPAGTAGGLMVATFGAPVAVSIADNVIADNGSFNCQIEGAPTAAVLTSLGGNVVSDASCAPVAADVIVGAGGAGVTELADHGGPTSTHSLLAGSAAIDAAVGACPATDQRGVARPQGTACDAGAVELVG